MVNLAAAKCDRLDPRAAITERDLDLGTLVMLWQVWEPRVRTIGYITCKNMGVEPADLMDADARQLSHSQSQCSVRSVTSTMIYLVESRQSRIRRGVEESVGVRAAVYKPEVYMHLLDLTVDEISQCRPFPSTPARTGPSTEEWWFVPGGQATACWPGIRNTRLKATGRPLYEVLAARR
jgi:hypothetical protein